MSVGAFLDFWAINQVPLSNWQLSASYVSAGLTVWQAVIAVIIDKAIISAVAIANGYAGAKWHISFPVVCRYVWAMYGQHVALAQRVVLSIVWFGVQSWTGGLCVQNILASIFSGFQNMENTMPESANMNTKQFGSFVTFSWLHLCERSRKGSSTSSFT
ncbi:hypothetical protein MBLNU230_g7433t1 [Neophaeotheca triangularis]